MLVQAAEYRARDAARAIEGAVATVGQVTVEPGGTNVIPGRVVIVDARAPDAERLDRLAGALEVEEPIRTEPAPMAEEIRDALRAEVEALAAGARGPVRRRPRCRDPRVRRCAGPLPQRRHQPQPGRAQLAGGHRARSGGSTWRVEETGDVKAVVVGLERVTAGNIDARSADTPRSTSR